MQQLIAHNRNVSTASSGLPSFLARVVLLIFKFRKLKMIFFKTGPFFRHMTSWVVSFLCIFVRTPARILGTFWCLWCRHSQSKTITRNISYAQTRINKQQFPFRSRNPHQLQYGGILKKRNKLLSTGLRVMNKEVGINIENGGKMAEM